METRFSSASGWPEAAETGTATVRGRIADCACTMAGGLVIVAGAILSLVLGAAGPHRTGPAAASAAAAFGLIMVGLGAALRAVPPRYTRITAATALGLAAAGAVTFAVTGLRLFGVSALAHTVYGLTACVAVPWLYPAGLSTLAKYQPCIGTVVAVAGCLAAAAGAISSARFWPRAAARTT